MSYECPSKSKIYIPILEHCDFFIALNVNRTFYYTGNMKSCFIHSLIYSSKEEKTASNTSLTTKDHSEVSVQRQEDHQDVRSKAEGIAVKSADTNNGAVKSGGGSGQSDAATTKSDDGQPESSAAPAVVEKGNANVAADNGVCEGGASAEAQSGSEEITPALPSAVVKQDNSLDPALHPSEESSVTATRPEQENFAEVEIMKEAEAVQAGSEVHGGEGDVAAQDGANVIPQVGGQSSEVTEITEPGNSNSASEEICSSETDQPLEGGNDNNMLPGVAQSGDQLEDQSSATSVRTASAEPGQAEIVSQGDGGGGSDGVVYEVIHEEGTSSSSSIVAEVVEGGSGVETLSGGVVGTGEVMGQEVGAAVSTSTSVEQHVEHHVVQQAAESGVMEQHVVTGGTSGGGGGGVVTTLASVGELHADWCDIVAKRFCYSLKRFEIIEIV